jgi:hypothetical protein
MPVNACSDRETVASGREGMKLLTDERHQFTVALVDDYELVLRGVAAMLQPFSPRSRGEVMDLGDEPSSRGPLVGSTHFGSVDDLDRIHLRETCVLNDQEYDELSMSTRPTERR